MAEATETFKAKLVDAEAVFDVTFVASAPFASAPPPASAPAAAALGPDSLLHSVKISLGGENVNLLLSKIESSSPLKDASSAGQRRCVEVDYPSVRSFVPMHWQVRADVWRCVFFQRVLSSVRSYLRRLQEMPSTL